jgi:hypothetical protein
MSARARDAKAAGEGKGSAPTNGWFEQEPAPGPRIRQLGARLLRRGRASVALWLTLALVASALWTIRKVFGTPVYDVTVVLRVTEGRLSKTGEHLGRGTLREYIDRVALTNPRLTDVMKRHPEAFPRLETDPALALESFREHMKLVISANDMLEERDEDDPPRSARVELGFEGNDPDLTWKVAQELAELVTKSTMAGQRARVEEELASATGAVVAAQEALRQLGPAAPGMRNPAIEQAQERLVEAQRRATQAAMAARGVGAQQVLKFEVADRGRVPPRPSRLRLALTHGISSVIMAILAAWLLAGAFDPRVLDSQDVVELDLPLLGRVPADDPGLPPSEPPAPRPDDPVAAGRRTLPRV